MPRHQILSQAFHYSTCQNIKKLIWLLVVPWNWYILIPTLEKYSYKNMQKMLCMTVTCFLGGFWAGWNGNTGTSYPEIWRCCHKGPSLSGWEARSHHARKGSGNISSSWTNSKIATATWSHSWQQGTYFWNPFQSPTLCC